MQRSRLLAGFLIAAIVIATLYGCGCNEEEESKKEEPPAVKAVVTVDPQTIYAGEAISYDATASNGTDLSYHWAFGDGTTATRASGTHIYDTVGKYQLTLTVTDGNGRRDKSAAQIRVYHHSVASGTLTVANNRYQNAIPVEYAAQSIVATLTYPSEGRSENNLDLYLFLPNGTEAYNSRDQERDPGPEQEEKLVVPFQVIAAQHYEDWTAEVRYGKGLSVEYALEITVTY